MRERPSWPMKEWEVRAILDGRKTMTRRVITGRFDIVTFPDFPDGTKWPIKVDEHGRQHDEYMDCPFGVPGDLLWVREKFRLFNAREECSHYESCDCMKYHNTPMYYADAIDNESKWKPSIHMPRWASRINLEITEVHVERLQDISEEDAVDEGTAYYIAAGKMKCEIMSMRSAFADLWDSLNAKRGFGWDADPWVWVIGFGRAA